jgi:hypothetical protein
MSQMEIGSLRPGEGLVGKLPDRFQEAESRPVGGWIVKHEGRVDQPGQRVNDVRTTCGTERLNRGVIEASSEHTETSQERFLRIGEELIRPLDGRCQCLVPVRDTTSWDGGQVELVVESGGNGVDSMSS